MKENKTSYERLLGEKIIETLSRNRITKRFRVELEEQISYNGKSAQYQHHLASTIYAILGGVSERSLSSKLEDFWYNEDQEPLAQRFLEGTIAYLKSNYQETLFRINDTMISDPGAPEEEEKEKYASNFFIFTFNRRSSTLAQY